MAITSFGLRLMCRIFAPFGAFFLLTRLLGAEIYASFLLHFTFFTGAVGLVTSPLEHSLIRMRSRPGYGRKFAQLFWAYLGISVVACLIAGVIYSFIVDGAEFITQNIESLPFILVAVLAYQVGYFLKFIRSDWYYYYSDLLNYLLIVSLVALSNFFLDSSLQIFSCLYSFVYSVVLATRLFQMSYINSIGWPQPRRIGLLILQAFRSTSLISLFGALIKRVDSFYMPVLGVSSDAMLVYRLVRNCIASVSLIGNLYAQDIWMVGETPRRTFQPTLYILITIGMFFVFLGVVWVYLMWLNIFNPLQSLDILCIGLATLASVYLSLNSALINRAFQGGYYDVLLMGTLLSSVCFLIMLGLGWSAKFDFVMYLLVLVFIPQLINGVYIKVQIDK